MNNSYASNGINMPYGVTPVSHDIYDLHMAAFYISCLIAAVVFSLIAYSLIKFRKSKHETPAQFTGNHKLEFVWTLILK